MAEVRTDASFDEPGGPVDDGPGPGDPPPLDVPSWPVYDGRTETVSDFPDPVVAARPRRRWPLAAGAAMLAAVVVTLAWVGVYGAPAALHPAAEQQWPVTPAQWERVDASLTDGLVIVSGAAEADGLVLDRSGLVATSYTAVLGDRDAPADGFELRVVPDGQDAVPATIVATDKAADIAIVRAPGFSPTSAARTGTPVRVGETLTLLDDQGGRQPVVGIGVVVTASGQTCSRAGSSARPIGFRFSLKVATAEPGAALVRADGTVVGMYYGGDDAAHHCAIPIADVLKAGQAAG